jgi:hypothetical protein
LLAELFGELFAYARTGACDERYFVCHFCPSRFVNMITTFSVSHLRIKGNLKAHLPNDIIIFIDGFQIYVVLYQ